MSNKLTIYHGSSQIIEKPIYGIGNLRNDYGLGFYCTENIELAKEWACTSENNGYANCYELDASELSILNLNDGSYHILNWLAILLENRIFRIDADIALEGSQYVREKFMPYYKKYDLIKGYRADDSYFTFANAFLNNGISLAKLEKAMVLGKLGEQVVLKSKKAFGRIKYIDSSVAEQEIYYPKKLARDTAAREDFKKEREKKTAANEIFLVDIIREGWENDDQRLQRIIFR